MKGMPDPEPHELIVWVEHDFEDPAPIRYEDEPSEPKSDDEAPPRDA